MSRFLDGLIANPPAHARFLNMLSLLEHRGSRKIMLSQMNGALSGETLKHLAEETRHAFFFKRQAEKTACATLDDYAPGNTMAKSSALIYFARLDAEVTRATQPHATGEEPYLFVSLIVELRACWLYHLYQDALTRNKSPISLKSVIAEEAMHLNDMYDALCHCRSMGEDVMGPLAALETALFGKFWSVLRAQQPALAA